MRLPLFHYASPLVRLCYAFEPKPRVLSVLIHLKKKGIEEIDDDRLLLFRLMFIV